MTDPQVKIIILLALVIIFFISFFRLQPKPKKEPRTFPYKIKNQIWVDRNGTCENCKIKLVPFKGEGNSAEFDHTKSYSKGGKTNYKNCTLLCRTCNRRKSNH